MRLYSRENRRAGWKPILLGFEVSDFPLPKIRKLFFFKALKRDPDWGKKRETYFICSTISFF